MRVAALLMLAFVATARADDPGWDRPAAARHLDDRARAWFDFAGATRGQGTTKVTCLSCHSFVPYLLARTELGDIPGEGPRDKSLAQIKERVAHWAELDSPGWKLYYDMSPGKKRQSRGTEAVLNALVLGSDDRAKGSRSPGESTKTALEILWSTQLGDGPDAGSWDWLDFGLEPWEAGDGRFFGATLAARAAGTVPGYDIRSADVRPRLDRLRGYLRRRFADQGLFNRVAMLRASAALDGLLDGPERSKLVGEILATQREDGGWSLSSFGDFQRSDGTPEDTASDGLATGFVLDAFRASGLPRSDPKVARGLEWLRRNQQKDGGWIASSLNKKRDPKSHVGRFMSDAASAYAVLALSRED